MRRSLAYRAQAVVFGAYRHLPGRLRRAVKALVARWASGPRHPGPVTGVGRRGAVVCLPVIDWEVRFQRPQQLLTRLAAHGWRVAYLRKDFAGGKTASVPLAPGVVGVVLDSDRPLNVYRDVPGEPSVHGWADRVLALEPGPAVTFVEWPFWAPLAFELKRRASWPVVYDCLDDHAAMGAPASHLALERELVSRADLVVCSSRLLLERWSGRARRTELLANGADPDHFRAARGSGEEQGRRESATVGYFGALSPWFDATLLEHAARAHREWRFVIAGLPAGADLQPLAGLANVALCGEVPYRRLPRLLAGFDVATIPFRLDPVTAAANPIKFFEYLSAGKPVVATPLPELEPYRELFYPAGSPEEFAAQIGRALAERNEGLVERRVLAAREASWDVRAARLEHLLDELLGSSSGSRDLDA